MQTLYATTAGGTVARFSYPDDHTAGVPAGYTEIDAAQADAAINAAVAAVNDTDATTPDDIVSPRGRGFVLDWTSSGVSQTFTPTATGLYVVRTWGRAHWRNRGTGTPTTVLYLGTSSGGRDVLDTRATRSRAERQTGQDTDGHPTHQRNYLVAFEGDRTYWARMIQGGGSLLVQGNTTITWDRAA